MGAFASRWQFHHGHDHLMLEPRLNDAFTAEDQVVDIIESIEVPNRRHSVLLEHLRVQTNDVARLRFQPHDVDTSSQRLQIGIGPCRFPEGVHHVEGIFVAIEIQRLEAGSSASFEIADARVLGCFQSRQEVRS